MMRNMSIPATEMKKLHAKNYCYFKLVECLEIKNILIVSVIPTSNERNGGLADFPSGSLLLNVLVIEGLLETDHHDAIVAAKELASALIKTVHEGFLNHNSVFENVNTYI